MINKKIRKPDEGDLVTIQLDDGRLALGVLARVEIARPRKPYGIFVYFFGPFTDLSCIERFVPLLSWEKAVCRLNTSALGIYQNQWSQIGSLPEWNRDEWPFPDFYIEHEFSRKKWRRMISEVDLVTVITQEAVNEIGDLELDEVSGSEAARVIVSLKMQGLASI